MRTLSARFLFVAFLVFLCIYLSSTKYTLTKAAESDEEIESLQQHLSESQSESELPPLPLVTLEEMSDPQVATYIFTFKKGLSEEHRRATISKVADTTGDSPRSFDIGDFHGFAVKVQDQHLSTLSADENIENVEADSIVTAQARKLGIGRK